MDMSYYEQRPPMIPHDGAVHHPLGAGSYYFKEALIRYLNSQCSRPAIALHIGCQPNCSPHIGNITTFATGFALAGALKEKFKRDIRVKFILVDTAPAPGEDITINGIRYQKSLKQTGGLQINLAPFRRVLCKLSTLSNVAYDIDTTSLWVSNPAFPAVLREIVARRQLMGPHLSPGTGKLAIRASCPECGLADKHGINNQYHDNGRITFVCPTHGEHLVDPAVPGEREQLEFNTPLRNLIRILLCSRDPDQSWIMCTGSDYAGFYQEQLTWRLLERPEDAPIIFYAPLILDWSGVKLSKSMYVEQGAYKYLADTGRKYILDGDLFLACENGLDALFEEVKCWVEKPYMLFRNYSIEYIDGQLALRGMRPAPVISSP